MDIIEFTVIVNGFTVAARLAAYFFVWWPLAFMNPIFLVLAVALFLNTYAWSAVGKLQNRVAISAKYAWDNISRLNTWIERLEAREEK